MGLDPIMYTTVWMAATQAAFIGQIDPVTAAEVCHFAAQPETNAEVHDILDEVKAELYDWIPSDLAALKEAEIIQITGTHDDGTGKLRCCQIASLATAKGWHGGMVHASRVDINVVMDTLAQRYLPEDVEGEMFRHSNDIDFTGLADQFKANVENEVEKFRKALDEELNFLFPGKEE